VGRAALIGASLVVIGCGRHRPEIVADVVDASAGPIAIGSAAGVAAPQGAITSEDLGTDDGVVRAFDAITHARCTTAKGCICVHRGKSFPDLVVVGSVRASGACRLEGFFFRHAWYDALGPATRMVLAEMGWDDATRSRRVDLAMSWTREVMLRFDGIVDDKPAAFTAPGAPAFHPLEATWEPTGAIEVRAFVSDATTSAASTGSTLAWHEETLRFDPAGRVVKTSVGEFFSVTSK
jgi:hypothetical protein